MTGGRILALCGGVGGAKLALGLSRLLEGDRLGLAVNVGDDFEHHGLRVSPDLDTVLYTLSGKVDPDRGWGRAAESWRFMDALKALGGQAWFQLGDQDLAMHVLRTEMLRQGRPLSDIIARLAKALDINATVFPATDQLLPTMIETSQATLPFQAYFVRERCVPVVSAIRFPTAGDTSPSPAFASWLNAADLEGIIVCPSNPYLSIDPILAIPGVREMIRSAGVPVVAVSPLIGGKAIKGPTEKIMRELGIAPGLRSVADHYQGLIDGLLIDDADRGEAESLSGLGLTVAGAPILMTDEASKVAVARFALDLIAKLREARHG